MSYVVALKNLLLVSTVNYYSSKYGKRRWGIYTQYQPDAKLLAIGTGMLGPPEVHGINYFGHYHDLGNNYNIWFDNQIP